MRFFGLFLSKTDLWLFGIAGTLALAWVVFRLNDTLNKRNRFNQAAIDFHGAFTNILALLDTLKIGNDNVIESILLCNFTPHHDALLKFKLFLSKSQQAEIEKAWDEYCYFEKTFNGPNPKDHPFVKYSLGYWYLADNGEDDFKAKKQLAIENIKKIIAFAKLK